MLKIQIDTAIWEDEWFAELNAEQKLFWLYLISNPLINIAGYFKITMRSLIFVTGLSRNKITEIINLFEAEGKVRYIDNYMLVVNFSKYQCYNPSTKLSASRLLNSLPDKVKHTLSTRCRHGVDTVNNNSNNNNNNSHSDLLSFFKLITFLED